MSATARVLLSLVLVAGCGGSSDDEEAAPAIRYVEGGEPVAGAPVIVSTLLGDPLLETETDVDGAVVLDASEPALVTIKRTTAATWWNLNMFTVAPEDEILSVVVSPGQSLTVGSTVPAIDASIVGRVVLEFAEEAPATFLYNVATGSGFFNSGDFLEDVVANIPVPTALLEHGTLTVLVWAVDIDMRKSAYVVVDVDLAPLRDGQDEVHAEAPPWRTDFDDVAAAITGVSELWVSADTYAWRDGKRYLLGTDYGHFPGSPLPETVDISVQVPHGFADQLDIRAYNSDDLSPHWLSAGERLPATPGQVDFDIGGTAPPGCYAIDFEWLDSNLVQVGWDGGGGTEDGIDIRLRNAPFDGTVALPWHLLLPPGTTGLVLPTLPAALASSQINPDGPVEASVSHSDFSAADGYDTFLAAITAGGFAAATVGDTLREGACSLAN